MGEDRKPAVTDEEESGSSTSSCDEMPPGPHDSSDTASACSPGRGAESIGPAGKEVMLRPPETTVTCEPRPEKDYDSSATVCFFVLCISAPTYLFTSNTRENVGNLRTLVVCLGK